MRWSSIGVLTLALTLLAVLAGPASAHSFLATTDPSQGARLTDAPHSVALQLSEAVAPGSVQISVRRSDGSEVVTPPPATQSGNAVVRQPLPDVGSGVYVVSW